MAMLESDNVAGKRPAVYPAQAGIVHVSDGTYEITAAQNVDEAVVALCILPVGCIPLDFTVIADDLDTGGTPAIVFDAGGINSAEDDIDQDYISASTVAQGGGVARATLFPIVAPLATEKLFGIHITTAAATAAAGTIRGILTYRAAEYGV
jgi:hypothetical protein